MIFLLLACVPTPWEGVCNTEVPQSLGDMRPPVQVYQETDGGYLEAMQPDYAEVIIDEEGSLYLECHVLSPSARVYVYPSH